MANSFDDNRVGILVKKFVSSIHISEKQNYTDLYRGWESLAGEIAAHCKPIAIEGHTLVVAVDKPAWMQTVQFQSGRLIKELQKKVPELEIRSIFMKLEREKCRYIDKEVGE